MLKMNRNLALVGVFSVLLSGCGGTKLAYTTLKDSLTQSPDSSISDDQLQQIPYSVSYIRLGNSPQAMVVLESAQGSDRVWVSAQKEYVVTRYGRVVRTTGLEQNIADLHFNGQAPFAKGLASLKAIDYKTSGTIDLMPGYHYGLPFTATYKVVGQELVDINGDKKSLTRVDEAYSIPSVNYHVTNYYWLNQQGLVMKSMQQPIPGFSSFNLTLLKPYAQDLQ